MERGLPALGDPEAELRVTRATSTRFARDGSCDSRMAALDPHDALEVLGAIAAGGVEVAMDGADVPIESIRERADVHARIAREPSAGGAYSAVEQRSAAQR